MLDICYKDTAVNTFAALEELLERIGTFLAQHQISESACYAVELVVEELITNIIKYGYKDDEQHTIELKISLSPLLITLELRDDGEPFDPRQLPNLDLSAPVEQRFVGRLGVHLVKKHADILGYLQDSNGNLLTLGIKR